MKSVRFRTLFPLLAICSALMGVSASASFADAGSQSSQLVNPSSQMNDLQNQIANAQQHGQPFKQGQIASGATCGYGAPSPVFTPFGDSSSYALPTGGDLGAWALDHSTLSADHDGVTPAADSLSLPGNGKATSAPICIGAGNDAIRVMVKNNGSPNSDLKVNLLYENPDGSVHTVTLAKLQAGTTWQPSVTMPLGISALASAYPNGTAVVELQFQPEGLAGSDTWSLDGLYVAQTDAGAPAPTTTTTTASSTETTPDLGASSVPSQLIDTSHQVSDIEKKIADLQAKGQVAKLGKLSLAADCGFQTASEVFAPWGDTASYALAPGGDLSQTTGWAFHNAALGSDHDPYTTGSASLTFADGGSQAITPAMCVDMTNPTIRFFTKDTGGNGKSDIKVSVLYEDTNGNTQHLDLARVRAGSSWSPSISIPIGVNILSTASASGVTAVAFEFTVEGLQKGETLSIDNLYVDPFCGR